jgi:Flp pilus assembly protein TadB
MATKRRRTKHRGNAAGVVEARGRTGRRPTREERDPKAREAAERKQKRPARYEKPPTWKGAMTRGLLAAVGMVAISLFLLKSVGGALLLFPLVLVMYVLVSYYTDLWMYRRHLRSKTAANGKAARR